MNSTLAQESFQEAAPDVLLSERSASDSLAMPDQYELVFDFDRTPWRDVIRWVADECELALQFEDMPTGSFSYSDKAGFEPEKAIERLNLFLLPQGYALVRSGKLLSLINLSNPRSMQQLAALAPLTPVADLDSVGGQQVVKCIFPLEELDAEDAVEELSPLNLMTAPSVFSKTNQIMITDTAANLRNVKAILDAFAPRTMDNGTVVKSFALEHVKAEDVLVVARPHLGLATGEMIGIDVSLSADLQGRHIFVTGVEDKVLLIEGLVASIDVPQQSLSAPGASAVLQSHRVAGGNLQVVYDVLQTLMAGRSLRMSTDQAAGTIVALAEPELQSEIAQTVAELQASEAEFEVIPLKSVDPYFAISLLEEMLDLPGYGDDDEDILAAPKIDADPGGMRLFVRGKRHQIDQIRSIVAGLDAGAAVEGDAMRVLPLRGESAKKTLETAAKFWSRENPILYYEQSDDVPIDTERVISPSATGRSASEESAIENSATGGEVPEREPTRAAGSDAKPDVPTPIAALPNDDFRTQQLGRLTASVFSPATTEVFGQSARLLSPAPRADSPAIRCQLTDRGLLLQSDDLAALDSFEQTLLTIAGPKDRQPSPPIVFYLTYVRADDSLRMLSELLDGGEAANEAEVGTLVNGYVSSSDMYMSSLVTSRDGTMTMMAGSMTVVADTRLNRLIAQGTSKDIDRIESYLKIIDKDKSIADVATYGESHVIELQYTRASEVASTLREAYAGRVEGGSSSPGGAGGSGGGVSGGGGQPGKEQPDRDGDDEKSRKSKAAPNANQVARDLQPKMTIAVHEPSNSLIVTAPEPLFLEVEKLAKVIDGRGEQTVEVVSSANLPLLESMLGIETDRRSSSDRNSSASRSRSTTSSRFSSDKSRSDR